MGQQQTTCAPEEEFEGVMKRLAEVTRMLEHPSLPLADTIKLYAEGVDLERRAQGMLNAAEAEVLLLSQDGTIKPFGEKGPQK